MHVALRRNFSLFGKCYGPGRSVKRRGKSSSLHSKKSILVGECGFSVSDVISGGLLDHLGPLYLALGAKRLMVVWSFHIS